MLASNEFLSSYIPIVIFVAIALGVSLALVVVSLIFGKQKPDKEKLSAYECGFEAFDSSRMKFDVRYYLIAILFIIFDLEVVFLFPWAVSFEFMSPIMFWSMISFLLILTIGFIYEWRKGALEWD